MLQQTQVPRVMPKWLAFLDAFPTPAACAAAPLGDVLRLWQGLGYPRRARNLHAAATALSEFGEFPRTLDGLLALPGVGQYTARAVLAFAFEPTPRSSTPTSPACTHASHRAAADRRRRCRRRPTLRCRPGRLGVEPVPDGSRCATVCADRCAVRRVPVQATCAWHGVGPDPAIGSAGVSRTQSRFEGSERQARGRLMKALSERSVAAADAAEVMGHPAASRLIEALCAEGLVTLDDGWLRLP
jgi:A/G-specific adenine glycosylase